jgi:MFS family permease
MSSGGVPVDISLRAVFAGRRGRLLIALLFAEFGAAVHSIAYSSVLPLASRELNGSSLYGATLVAGSLAMIAVLAIGPGPLARLDPRRVLLLGTVLFVGGVALTVVAPTMEWVLAGSLVRGLAAGLLASFSLTAIGSLYEDTLRPRVLGMFAVVWLVPSLAGPALNAAVAVAFGWRGAMAWPAIIVLTARLLVGRDAGMIPWTRSTGHRLDVGSATVLLAGLMLAVTAPAMRAGWASAMLAGGVLLAVGASAWILRAQVHRHSRRFRTTGSLFGLCLAFFGASGIISLAVVDGLGQGVVASNIAVGAGLVAWALTGLRSPTVDERRGDSVLVGLLLLAAALALTFLTQTRMMAAQPSLVVLVAAWTLAGLGMGISYPRLSAEPMNGLSGNQVAPVATAVAFAETSGTAVGSLLGGGTYSLASSLDVPAHTSISWAFLLLTAPALISAGIARSRRRPTRPGAAQARRMSSTTTDPPANVEARDMA